MNKSEFQNLIRENKDKFICVTLASATLRYDYPHTAIVIAWNTGIGAKTTIKVMRGNGNDLKCQEELSKYKKWSLTI